MYGLISSITHTHTQSVTQVHISKKIVMSTFSSKLDSWVNHLPTSVLRAHIATQKHLSAITVRHWNHKEIPGNNPHIAALSN